MEYNNLTDLEFLLKLYSCPNQRSDLDVTFKELQDKTKICQRLGNKGIVDFDREISTVKITPAGQALVEMPSKQIPIAELELKVLEKIIQLGSVKLPQIQVNFKGKKLKAGQRDKIVRNFLQRGLVSAQTKIKSKDAQVWLTPKGIKCLQKVNDCFYSLLESPFPEGNSQQKPRKSIESEILQTIQDLDKELGTDNYLPIFHLRQKFQPSLSREELDQVLYRLEKGDRIELSALQEVKAYTPKQIDAGIPQNIGGPLFFITIN